MISLVYMQAAPLSIAFGAELSERLQDHFQPTPVLAILGRESPEQFLEGGVPDLEEGLEVDLLERDLHIVDLRNVHFDPILSEVRPLGKSEIADRILSSHAGIPTRVLSAILGANPDIVSAKRKRL
jgi:hypothetical protein